MANRRAYCHSPKCAGRSMDDQDLRVISITDYSMESRARVHCDWCGHEWEASINTVKHLRGFKEADRHHKQIFRGSTTNWYA